MSLVGSLNRVLKENPFCPLLNEYKHVIYDGVIEVSTVRIEANRAEARVTVVPRMPIRGDLFIAAFINGDRVAVARFDSSCEATLSNIPVKWNELRIFSFLEEIPLWIPRRQYEPIPQIAELVAK